MAAFDFENDSLFEEAVRKAVKKPTGSVSHVDVQSIAELWCSADVTPSNLMKLAPHTFVHLIAAGPQRAVLDGVILDVVGSTGSSPTIGRAFIAGRSVRINGREKFFPGLGTVDGFLPGTLAPTVDGTAFVPGVFSGNNFLPGLASHPAFGHKGDAFIPGMMLPLNTLPGQQMLETLQQALGTRLPRGLDLRSSIAIQNALFIPGTFSNATTFQRGVSIEYGRCATGGFDIDRAMSGRARVADECGKYTSGFGQKEFQCGGTAMVCKDQKTASMGERATRVLKAITETDFKPGMKKEEAVYEIVRTASRVTTDLAEYEADTASSPAECTIFRVDGDVITKKAIALEENQYIEVKKDGSVAKTTWDQETRTATDTEQILPPTPVNEPNSGTSQSKPESGGTCEEPKPFLLPPPSLRGGHACGYGTRYWLSARLVATTPICMGRYDKVIFPGAMERPNRAADRYRTRTVGSTHVQAATQLQRGSHRLRRERP